MPAKKKRKPAKRKVAKKRKPAKKKVAKKKVAKKKTTAKKTVNTVPVASEGEVESIGKVKAEIAEVVE